MRYYEAIRDDETLIDRMMKTRDELKTNEAKRAAFEAARVSCALDYDPLSYWLLNRYAAQAKLSFERRGLAHFTNTRLLDGLNAVTRPKMERLRCILRRPNCRLTCGDYAPLIDSPGNDAFLFLDPPYLLNRTSSPLYECSMDREEHVVLAERLRGCNHRWLMTIGDCRLTRDLYRGFRILTRRYTGAMPHRTHDRERTELLVMNY